MFECARHKCSLTATGSQRSEISKEHKNGSNDDDGDACGDYDFANEDIDLTLRMITTLILVGIVGIIMMMTSLVIMIVAMMMCCLCEGCWQFRK